MCIDQVTCSLFALRPLPNGQNRMGIPLVYYSSCSADITKKSQADLQAALVELNPLGVQAGHPALLVVGQQASTLVMPPPF